MRIRVSRTEVWQEDLQLTRAYRIAGEDIALAHNAFCMIFDQHGTYGIGAASPMPEICGETMEDTIHALHKASDFLSQQDFGIPESHWAILAKELAVTPAALAATDMAIYDLYCKAQGIPVWEYLGGKNREMQTSVTIGITSEAQAREELLSHLRNDFQIIKVKIGDDVDRDIAIVRKLREWGGTHFRLRVDANEGYDPALFQKFLSGVQDITIELIEQPFPAPSSEFMRGVPAGIRGRCMADEDLITENDARSLAEAHAFGVWNIKLMKSGGITPGKRIAHMAKENNIEVMWGCNDESRVSITAALHTAFSSPATKYLDLDGAFDIARDIVDGGFVLEKGKLRLTESPGLGVTLY